MNFHHRPIIETTKRPYDGKTAVWRLNTEMDPENGFSQYWELIAVRRPNRKRRK